MTNEEYERRAAEARDRYENGDLEEAHAYLDGIAGSLLKAAARGEDIQELARRWLELDNYIEDRWYA